MSFEWIDCSFFLKKSVNGSEVTINLIPYHRLQLVRDNQEVQDLAFQLRIDFQRNLMHDSSIGWNWHKSWTIPDINVELEVHPASDPTARLHCPRSLYAEIYIVKPIISKEYSLCVEDLGLDGNTCFELINSRCTFTGLKFSATSYNNEGSKFHFLLTVYDKSDEEGQPSKILLSRISTPIFVDSRKSAREAELIKLKKLSAYIEPFEVASIYKRFVKKESKKTRGYAEQQIENNLSGLYNYFGAANIRNKVKHPLFLAAKFSECFCIYYKGELLQPGGSVIELLQEALMAVYRTINCYRPPSKLPNKKIILVVKSENLMGRVSQYKRIPEFLEPIVSEDVGCLVDQTNIPEGFVLLQLTPELIQTYGRTLPDLQNSHKAVYSDYEQQLKQQSSPLQKKPPENEQPVSTEAQDQSFRMKKTASPPSQQKAPLKTVKQLQDELENEEEEESISSYSLSNNFPDVPLKCEMVIDPLRHRPMKLHHFLRANEHCKDYVFCQKRLLGDTKELSILNQLLRTDIEQMKTTLKRKHLERKEANEASMRFAVAMLPNYAS